jgi:hypothetical protein
VQNRWNAEQLYLDDRGRDNYKLAFEGWVTLPTANKMFEMAGMNEREMLSKARKADFQAIAMDLKASSSLTVVTKYDVSKNVIAKVTGSTKPDEFIIYSAHWDHLGIGKPDETGDSIYNGALDNATGSGGLGSGKWEVGSEKLEVGSRKLEVGGGKLEVGSLSSEI